MSIKKSPKWEEDMKNLSEYELVREANIQSNLRKLTDLGFLIPAPKPKNKRVYQLSEPIKLRQKLPRLCNDPIFEPTNKDEKEVSVSTKYSSLELSDWIPEKFLSVKSSSNCISWDNKKHHQHVSVSKCGKFIGTTGCAGYGAAFLKPGCNIRYWEIELITLGVGGFSIGLARAAWQGPYKSLGNVDVLNVAGVYHSNGSFYCNRKEYVLFGPTFKQGDVLTVQLSDSNEITFFLNKKFINIAPVETKFISTTKSSKKQIDSYVLACQPYMGGVARIITTLSNIP